MEEKNKALVKDYIEKVINTGDVSMIVQYISSDYTEVYKNKKYLLGINGAKEHIVGVRKTYPDLELTINHQIAEGEWVVTCYIMKGTHSGKWIGINPTGKKIEISGVNVDKIVNNRIVEHDGAANLFEGLLEIGAIKTVGEDEV